MLKFARKRSNSTERDPIKYRTSTNVCRSRSASEERQSAPSIRLVNQPVESAVQSFKLEAKKANTASMKKLGTFNDSQNAGSEDAQDIEKRNSSLSLSKPTFGPMTATLSQLLSQVQIEANELHPPPVLPKRSNNDLFPQSGTSLWKFELLDTSGESGYGTDSSDNNSLRSQDSIEQSPPPLPKRKPRRFVQFDSYVLLIQALKERDLQGVIGTISNVSAEALCTEDVIFYFHTAILRQDYEMTELLTRAGCEVNTFDHRGWSALHCACSVARLDMIKLLLQNGAAILARTHYSSQTGAQLLPPDNPSFSQCLAYLRCMEECLGTVNSKLTLGAANYKACRIDELSISKGDRLTVLRRGDMNNEMWWWIKNNSGEEGYVLRDLLALNSRY